ncbi:hypothetical protein HTG_12580 [Natrinema mahii]|nr:hypothetical protein HTG_12580 [Natrinema mahii]
MADQSDSDLTRRTALKSFSAAGVASLGVALGAGSVTATPDGPRIEIESSGSGKYAILIDDNAEAGSGTPDDNVNNTSGSTALQGEIEEGETHVFHTESANITYASLRGSVLVDVWDPNDVDSAGELTVQGNDTDYLVNVTGKIYAGDNTGEIDDEQATGGGDDYEHDYAASGTINALHSVPNDSSSNVIFEHNL